MSTTQENIFHYYFVSDSGPHSRAQDLEAEPGSHPTCLLFAHLFKPWWRSLATTAISGLAISSPNMSSIIAFSFQFRIVTQSRRIPTVACIRLNPQKHRYNAKVHALTEVITDFLHSSGGLVPTHRPQRESWSPRSTTRLLMWTFTSGFCLLSVTFERL